MSILTKKIAHLSSFDPITGTFDRNVIHYHIGNSSGNPMTPFSNSHNDGKIAIFGPEMRIMYIYIYIFVVLASITICAATDTIISAKSPKKLYKREN